MFSSLKSVPEYNFVGYFGTLPVFVRNKLGFYHEYHDDPEKEDHQEELEVFGKHF